MEYEVTARELTFESHGFSFLCIFGTHVNGGYVAILNWGVSAELSSFDNGYNFNRILEALRHSPNYAYLPVNEEIQTDIVYDLACMITVELSDTDDEPF